MPTASAVSAFAAGLNMGSAPGASLSSLFATHPPLQKRLDQLAKLDAQMHRGIAAN